MRIRKPMKEHTPNVFFTSDLHLGHKKILLYEDRPFETLEDMAKGIIKNWNSVVKPGDTVYVVGDISFWNKDKTRAILTELKGKIILIRGNHDNNSDQWYYDCGIYKVYDHAINYLNVFWVSHECMYMNKHMPFINIHGHIHGNSMKEEYYYNVSVEHHDYTPVPLQTIWAHAEKLFGIELDVHDKMHEQMERRHS